MLRDDKKQYSSCGETITGPLKYYRASLKKIQKQFIKPCSSLSRMRTNDYNTHDKPLHNKEPLHLDNNAQIEELDYLQVRVCNIFRSSDQEYIYSS